MPLNHQPVSDHIIFHSQFLWLPGEISGGEPPADKGTNKSKRRLAVNPTFSQSNILPIHVETWATISQ